MQEEAAAKSTPPKRYISQAPYGGPAHPLYVTVTYEIKLFPKKDKNTPYADADFTFKENFPSWVTPAQKKEILSKIIEQHTSPSYE